MGLVILLIWVFVVAFAATSAVIYWHHCRRARREMAIRSESVREAARRANELQLQIEALETYAKLVEYGVDPAVAITAKDVALPEMGKR